MSAPSFLDLDIEIGAGVGWFALTYAAQNPRRQLIALEHGKARFSSFQSRVSHHAPLVNLHPIQASAVHWITHHVQPESVSRYFLWYPNPYPKPRQANKRWARMPFAQHLVKTMKIGGELCLATNIEAYALEAREYFEALGLKTERFAPLEPQSKPRTHFEKKYLERGETCLDLQFRKHLRVLLEET